MEQSSFCYIFCECKDYKDVKIITLITLFLKVASSLTGRTSLLYKKVEIRPEIKTVRDSCIVIIFLFIYIYLH